MSEAGAGRPATPAVMPPAIATPPPLRVRDVARQVGERAASPVLGFVESFGDHMILMGKSFAWLFRRPFRLRLFLEQMEFVGVGSLPIVLLVGLFTGMVSALQAIMALSMFQQERWVGFGVGISLARELGPVFTALMITARAGSGMATELASMRVSEQIDALTTFAVSPIQYLVTPRIVASILMLPLMDIVFNVVGLAGGWVVATKIYDVDPGQAVALYRYYTDPTDYYQGMIKALVFGLTMSLTACYQGFNVRGGAKEVGLATTRAVVSSSVAILVLDFFLIQILSLVWPFGE